MPRAIRLRHLLITVTTVLSGAAIVAVHAKSNDLVNMRGVVVGVRFTPPVESTPPSTQPSLFRNAKVCADLNGNASCDPGEPFATTNPVGHFELHAPAVSLVADVSTSSLNDGVPVEKHLVFRAAPETIEEGARGNGPLKSSDDIVIGPLSTEIARLMAADSLTYQVAKLHTAQRLGVTSAQLVGDLNAMIDSPARQALLQESVVLTTRFGLAAKMFDRGDVSPAALALNPAATTPAITMKEAQEASMNLEGIPRYDHIFVIMLENKATTTIKNSIYAPRINQYLNQGNQLTSYFATGNPSEPNRIAVSSGDDWGVTDDSAWNCVPAGDTANAVEEPLPSGMSPCTNATNHNLKKPNLFSAMTHGGMTWRIYSESENPGRDFRRGGASDATIVAPDHVYDGGAPGVVAGIGTPGLMVTFSGSLYATKHNGSVSFQDVRKEWDFAASNRTLGGGQWDDAMRNSPSAPTEYDVDQFGTDLASGDLGNLNFLEPDQCDDMHGTTISGQVNGAGPTINGSDCDGGSKNIYRGDIYVDNLVQKIQASSVWQNPNKRVAIVLMFDEGTATTGFNSCCGWNPLGKPGRTGNGTVQGPLVKDANGEAAIDSSVLQYPNGNKGHGTSIFGILTNQNSAPKGIEDSDAHSHISFVRTLQDMFGLSDPGDDWSYMNRSKYTEKFIAAHIGLLPEYLGSADTHFDAVRPMNHLYVIPTGYQQKAGFVTPPGPQVGPDTTQRNVWALK